MDNAKSEGKARNRVVDIARLILFLPCAYAAFGIGLTVIGIGQIFFAPIKILRPIEPGIDIFIAAISCVTTGILIAPTWGRRVVVFIVIAIPPFVSLADAVHFLEKKESGIQFAGICAGNIFGMLAAWFILKRMRAFPSELADKSSRI